MAGDALDHHKDYYKAHRPVRRGRASPLLRIVRYKGDAHTAVWLAGISRAKVLPGVGEARVAGKILSCPRAGFGDFVDYVRAGDVRIGQLRVDRRRMEWAARGRNQQKSLRR